MKTYTALLPPLCSVKVLKQLCECIRQLHRSLRTGQIYVHWIRVFSRFNGVPFPATWGCNFLPYPDRRCEKRIEQVEASLL
jgi:hypothetical protein